MKTLQGVKIPLGKPKLMPVKKINHNKLNDLAYNYAVIGKYEEQRIKKITPLKDESIQLIEKAFMPKSPILSVMEENYVNKYIPKMLENLKPANYKD